MQTINLVDLLQFAITIIGASINAWMMILVLGDLKWIKRKHINGRARRIVRSRLTQETLRFISQVVLLWASIVALGLRPEIPDVITGRAETDAFLRVIVHRSVALIIVSVILAIKSIVARIDREAIENYTESTPLDPPMGI